jgi:Putative adhesin
VAQHGEVNLQQVDGAVNADASFNDVRLTDVKGAVEAKASHGGVSGQRLLAGVRAVSEGDDIVLDAVRGPIEAEAKRGGVRVTPDAPVDAPLSLRSSFGDVRLEVPDGSRFDLVAASDEGDVRVGVPHFEAGLRQKRRVEGRLGPGGVRVELHSLHGDVVVGSGASQPD